MNRISGIVLGLLMFTSATFAQVMLIESSKPCQVMIDGEVMDSLQPGEYLKIESFKGEHVISAIAYSGIYSYKMKTQLDNEQVSISIEHWKLHRNKLLSEIILNKNEHITFRAKNERIALLNEYGEREKYLAAPLLQKEINFVSDQLYSSPQGEMLVAVQYKKTPYYLKMSDLYFEIANEK